MISLGRYANVEFLGGKGFPLFWCLATCNSGKMCFLFCLLEARPAPCAPFMTFDCIHMHGLDAKSHWKLAKQECVNIPHSAQGHPNRPAKDGWCWHSASAGGLSALPDLKQCLHCAVQIYAFPYGFNFDPRHVKWTHHILHIHCAHPRCESCNAETINSVAVNPVAYPQRNP